MPKEKTRMEKVRDHLEPPAPDFGPITRKPDNFGDSEFCIAQLCNFWNVPFFKSGKKRFVEQMIEHGWNASEISKMDDKALHRSNWSKTSFHDRMLRNPGWFEEW